MRVSAPGQSKPGRFRKRFCTSRFSADSQKSVIGNKAVAAGGGLGRGSFPRILLRRRRERPRGRARHSRAGRAQMSSSKPAKRSPRASARSSAAMVRAWPRSSSRIQVSSTAANSTARPCARNMPTRAGGADTGGGQHPLLRRTARPLSASASGGSRRAERNSERTAARCGARMSSRRISTSTAGRAPARRPCRLHPQPALRGRSP